MKVLVKTGLDYLIPLQQLWNYDNVIIEHFCDPLTINNHNFDSLITAWDANNYHNLKPYRDSGVAVLEYIPDLNALFDACKSLVSFKSGNYTWARTVVDKSTGLEVTSKGGLVGKRFSPFFMRLNNGMTLENYYHLVIKGYGALGYKSWKDVKSLPPLKPINTIAESELMYLEFFRQNPSLLYELAVLGLNKVFTDVHANSDNTQANIYSIILNRIFEFIK